MLIVRSTPYDKGTSHTHSTSSFSFSKPFHHSSVVLTTTIPVTSSCHFFPISPAMHSSGSTHRRALKRENSQHSESPPPAKTRVVHYTDDMYQQLRSKIVDLEEEIKRLRDQKFCKQEFSVELSQSILTTLEKLALEDLQNATTLANNLKVSLSVAEARASDAEQKLDQCLSELDALKPRRSEVTDFASLHAYLEDRFNRM
ncbi:hypothetical protein EDD18DRAFT_1114233 [Armillaria luteobubalina]|uniref:Uncharacterized protein n=1 Tax=Armillaria luteobubalina TaxID=153913 RepID=A0AA39P5T5_9AGAR|nr:hypothetical protein EDD18DRAFT_1114233 [Armillaria luteobubalina]